MINQFPIKFTRNKSVVVDNSEETRISSKVVALFFILVVAGGLFYQSYLMIDLYFRYEVATTIKIEIPKKINPQAISICTRWTDVLDYEEFNRRYKTDYLFEDCVKNASTIRHLQNLVTARDVFDFTPKGNTILKKAWYRKTRDFQLYETDNKTYFVNQEFEVHKYLYLEYVCYNIFQTHDNKSKSYVSLSVTPAGSGMVQQLMFSNALERSTFMKISLHGKKVYPIRSLVVTPVINRHYDANTKKAAYNEFVIDHSRMTSYFLPSPYTTDCIVYRQYEGSHEHEAACAHACIRRRTLNQLEKLPFNIHVHENDTETDRKIVSYYDAIDRITREKIQEIQEYCLKEKCRRPDCEFRHAMTRTSSRSGKEFVIKYILPIIPSITIQSNPKFLLLDFITFMFSVISTWTGMAVYHFNPIKVLKVHKVLMRYSRERFPYFGNSKNRKRLFPQHPVQETTWTICRPSHAQPIHSQLRNYY
jgi:hypothetical protein